MSKYLKEIDGDLLEFPEGINILGHCANTRSAMGAGIAAQIRITHPQAAINDREYEFPEGEQRLGRFSTYKFRNEEGETKVIANIYGQLDPSTSKRAVNYEFIAQGVERLMLRAGKMKGSVVGFPKFMGCALAGGDWPIVESIIKTYAEKYSVRTVIVNWRENK